MKKKKDIDEESRIEDFLDWKCDSYSDGSNEKEDDNIFLRLNPQEKDARIKELWGI